jgi:hypothetical protein
MLCEPFRFLSLASRPIRMDGPGEHHAAVLCSSSAAPVDGMRNAHAISSHLLRSLRVPVLCFWKTRKGGMIGVSRSTNSGDTTPFVRSLMGDIPNQDLSMEIARVHAWCYDVWNVWPLDI